MKQITPALRSHLAQEVTTLAICWRITRRDGVIQGFTDHDQPIIHEGFLYDAATGFLPTAISSSSQLNVDNMDIEGMLSSDAIDEQDIIKGAYDFAEIEVFQVNYTAPEEGKLVLRYGWIGEVSYNGEIFVAEIRGLTQKLSQRIGQVFSPTCRASLGDSRCKADMSMRIVSGTVTAVTSSSIITDSSRLEEAGRFTHGLITFVTGGNAGISCEIKSFANHTITLTLPLPVMPSAGDAYSLSEGCDKYFSTCVKRFNNAVNFRGEPHIPGLDRMLETSTTRNI